MAPEQKVILFKKEAILVSILSFFLLLGTLSHYGINWDSINHLPRGQSYLHFFLTRNTSFLDEAPFKKYWQKDTDLFFNPDKPKQDVNSTSLYENAGVDYKYFISNDGGHPPLGGILASITNTIFFKDFKIINDIDAYRISGILLASLLVGLVYYWAASEFGRVAGLFSAISLMTYPLFWAESHFNNEKDIPLAFFWTLTLFLFHKLSQNKKISWIIACGLATGMALSVKFNALFIPFTILPTFLLSTFNERRLQLKYHLKLLLIPIIALSFFVIIWPYLWADPISKVQNVIGYYKEIGTTVSFDPRYITLFGFNTYASIWIIYTTPIITLLLSIIGVLVLVKKLLKTKNSLYLLLLCALFIPIIRVSLPHSNIYGGVRQIMEYIPAMAISAGIGMQSIYDFLNSKTKRSVLFLGVIVSFLILIVNLYKIHPAENAYFNALAGGLSGAKEMNIPSWGNTFGGIYRVGVNWLNTHAEPNSNIAYARELIPNIPSIWLRQDLSLYNQHRSGTLMLGEYVIALTYEGVEKTSYWDKYLAKFLTPVFVHNVDGVSVLSIWKNSPEYLNLKYKNTYPIQKVEYKTFEQGVFFDIGRVSNLAQLDFYFNLKSCNNKLTYAYAQISADGNSWERLPGMMPKEDWSVPKYGTFPDGNHVMIPFTADHARYVEVVIEPKDSCLYNVNKAVAKRFED